MKAAFFEQLGEPDVLQVVERPQDAPGPGEVLVRVTSVGLNRADLLFVAGRYFQKATLPSRVGMEPAGIVERVGDGVSNWSAGDRVGVLPSAFVLSAQGGLADYVTVPAKSLVATPAALSDEDAGAIWMQYLTAWGRAAMAGPRGTGTVRRDHGSVQFRGTRGDRVGQNVRRDSDCHNHQRG